MKIEKRLQYLGFTLFIIFSLLITLIGLASIITLTNARIILFIFVVALVASVILMSLGIYLEERQVRRGVR